MMSGAADVLIVGAGGAGLAAAIEAAERGARVTLLDAAAEVGGTARTAGGGTFIAGSPLQASLGFDDSPGAAIEDWLAWGGPAVDAEWARRYVEGSVPQLYGWLSELGVEWLGLQEHEGNRVPRWHSPRDGGLGIIRALHQKATSYPITWQFETRLTDLLLEGGRVVGVVASGPDGATLEYRAGAVLIASGGFNNNIEMVRRLAASVSTGARILLGGGRGALGQGHAILERVGAQLVNLDAIWMYPYATPDYREPSGLRGLVVRGLEGDIWVNSQGRRFHNEDQRGGATGAPALLAQDPPTCWSIIDSRIAARYHVADPTYRYGNTPIREQLWRLLDESPFIARGQTIEELADAVGLERAALRETVATHNRMLAHGLAIEPDFGRSLTGLDPLDEPPYYAIQFFPLARKNLGGVRTDLECQVLDRDGRPIAGLFAAGEVAGMAGGRINGRAALEGTMFGPSVYSGRVAGRTMVGARA